MLAMLDATVAEMAHHRAARTPGSAAPRRDLMALQRTAGNRAVSAMLGGSVTGSGRSAPRTHGSTATESEEETGPIGADRPQGNGRPVRTTTAPATDGGVTTTTAPATDGGVTTTTAPATDGGGAPAPPPPLTLTSATVKAAPSGGGAATRTDVGVGEVVTFTGSAAGTWTTTAGTTPAPGPPSTTFAWTAPATAQTVTVTITSGTQTASRTMTVHAPTGISMRAVGSHTSLLGPGGACMLTEVTFNPTTVCLGAIQWLEVPGPATGARDYFSRFSATTLHHNPNLNYAMVNDRNIMEAGPNNGPNDHCAWHALPGPYPPGGTFTWVIPNRYIVDGEPAASGRHFVDTHQVFTMTAAGVLTITKAGAST